MKTNEINIYRTDKTEEAVKKNPENSYTRIPTEIITDFRLTDGARCLLFYCISKPDDYIFYIERLAIEMGRTSKTIRTNLSILIELGYCHRTSISYEKNRYEFFESPNLNMNLTDEDRAKVPSKIEKKAEIKKRELQYKEYKSKIRIKNQSISTENAVKVGKDYLPKSEKQVGKDYLLSRESLPTKQVNVTVTGREMLPANNNCLTNNSSTNNSLFTMENSANEPKENITSKTLQENITKYFSWRLSKAKSLCADERNKILNQLDNQLPKIIDEQQKLYPWFKIPYLHEAFDDYVEEEKIRLTEKKKEEDRLFVSHIGEAVHQLVSKLYEDVTMASYQQSKD